MTTSKMTLVGIYNVEITKVQACAQRALGVATLSAGSVLDDFIYPVRTKYNKYI